MILFFTGLPPHCVRSGEGPASAHLLSLGLMFLLVGLAVDATITVSAGRAGAALGPEGSCRKVLAVAVGLTFATLALVLPGEFLRDVIS